MDEEGILLTRAINSEKKLKTCEEILTRAISILAFCDRCSLEEPNVDGAQYTVKNREKQRRIIYSWLEDKGYMDLLTPEERAAILTPVEKTKNLELRRKLDRYEALEPLLWAVGLVSKLTPPDKFVYTDFHPILEVNSSHKLNHLIKKCALKEVKEVMTYREVMMLWHWRTRIGVQELDDDIDTIIVRVFGEDYRGYIEKIKVSNNTRRDFIAFGETCYNLDSFQFAQLQSIIFWRHHAFEWILSSNHWDEIETNT